MKLRARLLSISLCALLVPVLVAIAIAAGVAVGSSGRIQSDRFNAAIRDVRKDMADTERRCSIALVRLAEAQTTQSKLYVYSTYWDYFSKDTLDGDIAGLRDLLEVNLISESLDTIAAYRIAGDHYSPVVVVGNSTHTSGVIPIPRNAPSGLPEYFQTSDGLYASFSMPVFKAGTGEAIGLLILQKAFNRGYFENLSMRFNTGIALYTQGLYRFTNLPGIDSAGALWARSHPTTGGLFSGTYPYQKRLYKYLGYYFQMGDAKGYLFVGGPSSITLAEWWGEFARQSVLPLVCVAIATVLFILWGSEVIRAIKSLLAASVKVGMGDLRVELPRRSDEFGALYKGFTEMAERLEESKRRLVTSERMAALGSFSAGVAHEINNPLGIILNHVQLLRSGRLTESERGQFLERVETEIIRVNRLLRNLLHHATEEELSFADFSLEPVVRDVVGLFSPKMRVKGIEVAVEPFPAELVIEGDVDAVKQVLFNLLYNAAQAIRHDHGRVAIRAEADPRGCRVRVSDNGEGMDQATLTRVFEPYFTRKHGYGTGLGLSLSQKIMKQHGGGLEVESRVNVGTTVTLRFPMKEGACQPGATTRS